MSVFPAARFLTSANRPAQFVDDSGIEVAFAGRSNAGKSSAINAIVGRRDFARTSKTPGRTQLVNFFELQPGRRLVDLPGYGYARVSQAMRDHWRTLMEGYFARRRSLAGLFVIVDSRRGIGDFDTQMLDWATTLACPVCVLLTKADKLSRAEGTRALVAARRAVNEAFPIELFSVPAGTGVEAARTRLQALLGEAEIKNPGRQSRGGTTPGVSSTGLG